MKEMKKYYIGFIVLGVLTAALTIYVIAQGSSYRNDRNVNETLSRIADDLNDYIVDRGTMPGTLAAATDEDIPPEITYSTHNGYYSICVTYSNGSGTELSAGSIVSQGLSANFSGDNYEYESDYKPSSLYVSTYSWQKGETCYEVEPYISRGSPFGNPSNPFNGADTWSNDDFEVNLDYLCDESYEYRDLYEDSCVDGEYIY